MVILPFFKVLRRNYRMPTGCVNGNKNDRWFGRGRSKALFLSKVQFNLSDSGLPTRRIPVAFRRVNHTFLYLYPRDT